MWGCEVALVKNMTTVGVITDEVLDKVELADEILDEEGQTEETLAEDCIMEEGKYNERLWGMWEMISVIEKDESTVKTPIVSSSSYIF